MAVSTLLLSAVFCSCLGIVQGQFFQDPCFNKNCSYGCRLLAEKCETRSCDLKPTCVPPQLAVSRFNPCAVAQPIIDVRGNQIMCSRDQCPSKSYCSARYGGVGVCCYDFKGYYVGSKLGFCRDPPRYFSNCKNDCASDHKCPFLQKCCMSPCGFSCQMSFVG